MGGEGRREQTWPGGGGAGSRADGSQEPFEEMGWEKGKHQSDGEKRRKRTEIDLCVLVCLLLFKKKKNVSAAAK